VDIGCLRAAVTAVTPKGGAAIAPRNFGTFQDYRLVKEHFDPDLTEAVAIAIADRIDIKPKRAITKDEALKLANQWLMDVREYPARLKLNSVLERIYRERIAAIQAKEAVLKKTPQGGIDIDNWPRTDATVNRDILSGQRNDPPTFKKHFNNYDEMANAKKSAAADLAALIEGDAKNNSANDQLKLMQAIRIHQLETLRDYFLLERAAGIKEKVAAAQLSDRDPNLDPSESTYAGAAKLVGHKHGVERERAPLTEEQLAYRPDDSAFDRVRMGKDNSLWKRKEEWRDRVIKFGKRTWVVLKFTPVIVGIAAANWYIVTSTIRNTNQIRRDGVGPWLQAQKDDLRAATLTPEEKNLADCLGEADTASKLLECLFRFKAKDIPVEAVECSLKLEMGEPMSPELREYYTKNKKYVEEKIRPPVTDAVAQYRRRAAARKRARDTADRFAKQLESEVALTLLQAVTDPQAATAPTEKAKTYLERYLYAATKHLERGGHAEIVKSKEEEIRDLFFCADPVEREKRLADIEAQDKSLAEDLKPFLNTIAKIIEIQNEVERLEKQP
jgi:hypothetical protein